MTNVRIVRGVSPTLNTVYLGPLTLVFSYETVVAFHTAETGWVASENVWGNTTGKHINAATDMAPKDRTPRAEFVERLNVLLARIEVNS